MAITGLGFWASDPNSKIPALSHVWTYRVQLPTAGTTATVATPDVNANPAQVTKVSPAQSNSQPQQGKRLIPYMMTVRDPAGVLAASGQSSGGTVAIINQTQSNAVIISGASTPGATSPLCQFFVLTSAPVLVNPYDQLAVTYTQSAGATSTATGFTVDFFGYWQQAG